MNARQAKKKLKIQIAKLKSDNNLMRKIIENCPQMAEMYDLYNKPVNLNVSTIQFQEYKTKRFIPPLNFYETGSLELIKEEIAKDLLDEIKEYINFELNTEYMQPTITASIIVGRK